MDPVTALLVGLALGLLLGGGTAWLVLRARPAGGEVGASAALLVERDLLRERVVDLEAAVTDDAQTAAALAPLRDALARVEGQVGTLERDRVDQFATLRAGLQRVESSAADLGRETRSLAGSLNASTVRGAWGEVQLRRVLEVAGLLARCDFDEQVTRVSRHDVTVRPDVVVSLPGSRHLVVDAKAPMTAFLQAQADDLTDDERAGLLRRHAQAVAGHVSRLAAKDYWSAFDTSPEVVVCFVPSDAMLGTALAADPSLHESALARRVVLVGPGSLLALLRTVAFTWQQDALADGARELLTLGRELHSRLGTLGSHTAQLGRTLQRAVEGYNQLVGALESRVLVQARRMQDLGVAEGDLVAPRPVEVAPRVLTAVELLEHVAQEEARAELDFGSSRRADDDAGRATG